MKSKERLAAYRRPTLVEAPGVTSPATARWMGWILPSLCLVLVAAMSVYRNEVSDLWWQLRTGELIWTSRSVPHRDVFSHTAAGQPWYVQEWLSELFLYGLYRIVSPDALVAFRMLLPALACGLTLWTCRLRGASPGLAAAVTAAAAYAARPFFDFRPQLFTYVFLALSLLLIEQWRAAGAVGSRQSAVGSPDGQNAGSSGDARSRLPTAYCLLPTGPSRAIWLLPLLALLWVNLHAGFMLLFVLLGVEFVAEVGRALSVERWALSPDAGSQDSTLNAQRSTLPSVPRWMTLAGVMLLCGLAAVVNPDGVAAYRYPFLLLRHKHMVDHIVEWWSPNFHDLWTQPLGYFLLLLAFAMAASRTVRMRDLILSVGLVHMALSSNRHMPLFALGCAPIIAGRLAEVIQRLEMWMAQRRWSYAGLRTAAAIALGIVLSARLAVHAQEFPPAEFPPGHWLEFSAEMRACPVRACDFLLSQPGEGRLYNEFGWGGYCIWRLWPRYRVFIDGRAEVYFNAGYADYLEIRSLKPGWEALLRRWNVDTVLLPTGDPMAEALAGKPDWTLIYRDEQAVVLRWRGTQG